MKLTIIQTGEVPAALRDRFGPYPPMFERMFAEAGENFACEAAVALCINNHDPRLPVCAATAIEIMTEANASLFI